MSGDIIRIDGVEYERRYFEDNDFDAKAYLLRLKRKQTGWIKRSERNVEVHVTSSDNPYYPNNGFKPFYGKAVE